MRLARTMRSRSDMTKAVLSATGVAALFCFSIYLAIRDGVHRGDWIGFAVAIFGIFLFGAMLTVGFVRLRRRPPRGPRHV